MYIVSQKFESVLERDEFKKNTNNLKSPQAIYQHVVNVCSAVQY